MNIGRSERSRNNPDAYIHVGRGEDEAWLVKKGHQNSAIASYRLKYQAMAFARAVAFSRGVDMIVHDRDGHATRHHRASLTYPTRLD